MLEVANSAIGAKLFVATVGFTKIELALFGSTA